MMETLQKSILPGFVSPLSWNPQDQPNMQTLSRLKTMKHHTPYNMNKMTGWVIILFLTVSLSNCSETNSDAPPSDAAHPRAWYNPQFLTSDIFHGMNAAQDGIDSCRICHGSNLKGDNDIPGCYTCHFGPDGSKTPDGSVWIHGQEQHGEYESFEPVCNNCHALERRYGLDPATCHDCHGDGINHVTGQAWLDKNSAQFHGDNNELNCADCHDLNTYCATCHFGETGSKSPPGSGWIHGDNEDHRRYESSRNVCNQCHSLNRSYGNEPGRCHDCHDG